MWGMTPGRRRGGEGGEEGGEGEEGETAAGDGGLDEGVQLLVPADGEVEVAGRDALDLEVLGGVAGELEDLSREVLEDGGAVDGGGGAHPPVRRRPLLEEPVDAAHGELQSQLLLLLATVGGEGGGDLEAGAGGAADDLGLRLPRVLPCLPLPARLQHNTHHHICGQKGR